ncbi:MAG: NADH-quinone oxidoreductase subunit G, partial [Casimicrobiaceae bacterium]
TMEGAITQPPAALVPFVWSPGWNSIQSTNLFQREIAGPMKGGDAGVRLIEPAASAGATPAAAIPAAIPAVMPAAFQRRHDEWLIVPLYHVFGSEELSNAAPSVASLAPAAPYVALNDADALALDAQPGDVIELTLDGETHRLPLLRASALPQGVAGLPIGLPDLPAVTLPAWSRLVRRQ